MPQQNSKIAYFSMEFALDPAIPNFAGGLGVLATDMVKSGADLGTPMVGVSLIYHMSDDISQGFDPSKFFKKRPESITVKIENRDVKIGAWEYIIKGVEGHEVPIYFLTSHFPENERWDRDLTKFLYPSNQYTRLAQEVILGIGGLRMLRKMGYNDLEYFHLNEGHASFLTFERLKEVNFDDEKVRQSCRFTTHTPIAAGHDRFPYRLANQVMGDVLPLHIKKLASADELHTTKLAMNLCAKTNAVSQKHKEVCKKMFPDHDFLGVTNGVHHNSWIVGPMRSLFDKYIKGWQQNPYLLSKALEIPNDELMETHKKNKEKLVGYINQNPDYFPYPEGDLQKDDYFNTDTLTITFSRRFVPYKRPLLLFHNMDRLREIGYRKLQVIYSGHCHPQDEFCNNIMSELKHLEKELRGQIRLAVMPDRNLDSSALLVAGSDIWLNNPEPPLEASGTSGMKAAMNGGINLSVADGWWIEAAEQDPKSGWTFGADMAGHDDMDADSLYQALEEVIDCYNNHPAIWAKRMKHSIALGAYFNTHRCLSEYIERMWS